MQSQYTDEMCVDLGFPLIGPTLVPGCVYACEAGYGEVDGTTGLYLFIAGDEGKAINLTCGYMIEVVHEMFRHVPNVTLTIPNGVC